MCIQTVVVGVLLRHGFMFGFIVVRMSFLLSQSVVIVLLNKVIQNNSENIETKQSCQIDRYILVFMLITILLKCIT